MKNIVHPVIRFLIRVTSYFFFEKIEVSGLENLPPNCPVIFACNHPNSFLDSIVLTTSTHRPLYYTARGDFFKSKIAARLLRYINILPVFRKEEGIKYLNKNNETFSGCIEILKKNGAVIIFSEGVCENEWDLRPLRKGTARLAHKAWNETDIGDKLKIVPVAIHYSSWLKTRPRVYIEFLENIDRKYFSDITEEGLFNKKFNEILKNILSGKCITVDKSTGIEVQNKITGFILKNFNNGNILAKKIQDKYLSSGNDILKANYNKLSEFLIKEKINYYKKHNVGVTRFLFSVPAFLIARISNALPYFISKFIVWKATKGNAFYDSLIYCILWLVYSIYLLVLFLIAVVYFNFWAGIFIVLLITASASIYEASKRNINCFLKKNKLKLVHQMLNALLEAGND